MRVAIKFALASMASISALTAAITSAAAQPQQQSQQTRVFDLPEQPLGQALTQLADLANISVFVPGDLVRGRRSPVVRGAATPEQVLDLLLANSGLTYRSNGNGAYSIVAQSADARSTRGDIDRALTAGDVEPGGEVVVTGSRLKSSGFTAPTPVTVVNSDMIAARAPSSILDLMNDVPAFRLSAGPHQATRNAAGPGQQNTFDLRGLGAPRTLVLVDGRRFVPTNTGGTVDASLIPTGLIERVDVVTGASAAYGSDAVAGVANVILMSRLTGLHGNILGGRSSKGDNDEYGFGFSGGTDLFEGRGHFMAGVEYNRNDGVGTIYTRDWSSVEPGNTVSPLAFGANRAADVPANGFLPNVEFATATFGSVINGARGPSGPSQALNQTAFNANGSSYTLVRGPVYGGSLMQGVTTNYGATPLGNWPLKTPRRAGSAMARFNFDIDDNTSLFAELSIGRSQVRAYSSFYITQSSLIGLDNAFLPTDIRDRMIAANITQIDIGRVNTEWGGLAADVDIESTRFITGMRGHVFEDWNWDFYVQLGKTENETINTGSRVSNILAAQYAVRDAGGNIVCGPLATNPNFASSLLSAFVDPRMVTPGCVPFNPFGYGQSSQRAIDYVSGHEFTQTAIRQDVAAVNLSGSPISTWAGPVDLATGLEIRRDTLSQVADPLQILGIYSTVNNKTFSGENTVMEGYIEVGVPIVRDVPFIHSLDFNGAVRRTNYETSGLVTTWKAGGSWELDDTTRLRMTKSRDIRAPNLSDLFAVGSTISSAAIITNPFTGQAARLPTTTSGNPNLRPEIADTFTAGVVVQPRLDWASGLKISVDYYNIKLRDVIATTSAIDTLIRCYAGLQEYCAAVEFDNTPYGVRNVTTGPFNQASLETNGVDLELAYTVPERVLPGRLDFRALATYVDDLLRIDRAGVNTLVSIDAAGSAGASGSAPGVPSWTGSFSVNYDLAPVTLGMQVRTFSKFKYDNKYFGPDDGAQYNPASPDSINISRFPSLVYVNVNAAYKFENGFRLYGVVNNLLDQEPPYLSLAALNSGGNPYDWVGRTAKVGLRFDW